MNGSLDTRFGALGVAEDQEAMMRQFEIAADDDDEDASNPNSPVLRRTSYQNDD
jgi:hypothetical protein